ncbi:hypothetical protein MH215_06335 [Paenibacillus sp. ACRSA]|uniref:hypothetical protein n=1 Tax=Paenibacillus sp. ACRSA TaxID=2918211 RepID=UPI001EF5146E|nr:hypothetical protein [Paenibacillus sp. ACRSA]MCG7376606.1 hypothetical protein [Paenibacillus sp. ACRSA]
MTEQVLEHMTKAQQHLVNQSMAYMDGLYVDDARLIQSYENTEELDTRGSAHYALGLLLRNGEGDAHRAEQVIQKVLAMQYEAPDEIYHGTFRTRPDVSDPPRGNYNWKEFAPGTAYFLERTFEKVSAKFIDALWNEESILNESTERKQVKKMFQSAMDQVLPPVWTSYDPNWREFIACAFAVILAEFSHRLPQQLVEQMEYAMKLAVAASMDRLKSDVIPMNTNIELMHIFITHFYGHRFKHGDWIAHSDEQAERMLKEFMVYDSFAEFNSTTYYGVDLTVLGIWRTYGSTAQFIEIGRMVEAGLWNNIALFYNANLENLSGPFARAYDMEMTAHSSVGMFIYLLLGETYVRLADVNCEVEHGPLIALVGGEAPLEVIPFLKEHQGDRLVQKQFIELCERDEPASNRNLCTAKAWVGEKRMIGAMSGSRNTNGQMFPATIHWQSDQGDLYDLRLTRREVGESWNTHLRGITFEADLTEDSLTIEVRLETVNEIEVYFEIRGSFIEKDNIQDHQWRLPGLICAVTAEAPAPSVLNYPQYTEIIYRYVPGVSSNTMRFKLNFQ